jgi:riboflavin biosynthesis pyrimidine reductase
MTEAQQRPLPRLVDDYTRLRFLDPPQSRPYVILNMVSSADGKAVAGGTESALSSPVDKLVLQTLRIHADAIVNGLGTARATGVNPSVRDAQLRGRRGQAGRLRPPLQVLITRGAGISADAPYFQSRDFDRVLFIAADAEPAEAETIRRSGTSVELVPQGYAGITAMLKSLRDRYAVRLLLLEGGPELNASFFHAQAVDEFFLTLGPHIVGGRSTITPVEGDAFLPESMPRLELVSARPHEQTSEVYLHWRVRYDLP